MSDGEVQFIDDDPPDRFTVIDNDFLNCPDLSWKATAILTYLKGRPPGWRVRIAHLATVKTDGRTSVETGLKELIELGYMRRDVVRESGRVVGVSYRFSWTPRWKSDDSRFGMRAAGTQKPSSAPLAASPSTPPPKAENPFTENPETVSPETVSPCTENPRLVSTEVQQELISASTEKHTVAETTDAPPPAAPYAVSTPNGADGVSTKGDEDVDVVHSMDQRWVDARTVAEAIRDRRAAYVAGGDPESFPVNSRPKVTQKAIQDADLLLRRGALGLEKAQPMPLGKVLASIDYLFTHLADPGRDGFCWAKVVRSPGNLRENWTQIALAARDKRSSASRPAPQPVDDGREAAMRWAEQQDQMKDQTSSIPHQPPLLQLVAGGQE